MSNVIPAFGQPLMGEPNENVVTALEDLLARARRGEIESLAYAFLDRLDRGSYGFETSPTMNWTAFIGSIAVLQTIVINQLCVSENHVGIPDVEA